MRPIFIFILCLTLSPLKPTTTQATTISDRDAAVLKINLSGRQRMLTQRMSKAVCFVFMGIERERHRQQTYDSFVLFDRTLNGLATGDPSVGLTPEPSKDIVDQLAVVARLWMAVNTSFVYAAEASHGVTDELELIASLNTDLLFESNEAVKLFETTYGDGVIDPVLAVTVNIAGRQRMLTQRASKEVCMIAAGMEPEKHRKSLRKTVELFEMSLQALLFGNSEIEVIAPPRKEIGNQLSVVAELWGRLKPVFEQVMEGETVSPEILSAVAAKNDRLLKEMNKAVGMY